jgi:hypothetical protein
VRAATPGVDDLEGGEGLDDARRVTVFTIPCAQHAVLVVAPRQHATIDCRQQSRNGQPAPRHPTHEVAADAHAG